MIGTDDRNGDCSYSEQFDMIAGQFKNQCCENYTDAHTTYDMIRDFSSTSFRSLGRKSVDAIFTAMYTKEELESVNRVIGGFVGPEPNTEFLYINVTTLCDKSFVTYVSNLKQMNYSLLERYGMEPRYDFPNSETTTAIV